MWWLAPVILALMRYLCRPGLCKKESIFKGKEMDLELDMVTHIFNFSAQDASGSQRVQGQPEIHSETQLSPEKKKRKKWIFLDSYLV